MQAEQKQTETAAKTLPKFWKHPSKVWIIWFVEPATIVANLAAAMPPRLPATVEHNCHRWPSTTENQLEIAEVGRSFHPKSGPLVGLEANPLRLLFLEIPRSPNGRPPCDTFKQHCFQSFQIWTNRFMIFHDGSCFLYPIFAFMSVIHSVS